MEDCQKKHKPNTLDTHCYY